MAAVASGGYPSIGGNGSNGLTRHPILEKGVFAQLQRNDVVEARPQVLHFGGFQIHKRHTLCLRIMNISPSSLRVTIIAPTTPYFKLDYDKKGLLAPGMGEEITVVFEPHEWRYYHDTVKIFCGELSENLVVPIHAYPSANEITLPKIVDFGAVAVGTSRTKVIPLSCKIPIGFEFEVEVLEPHPDFEVNPMSGVIPANGTTNVVITFIPSKHWTARTELLFKISQFDWEPVVVNVVGSCHPGLSHAEVLQHAESELVATAKHQVQETMAAKVRSLKNKRGRGPVEASPPHFPVDVADRMVDGVKVPTRFDQQSTNFVLGQTPGKLEMRTKIKMLTAERRGYQPEGIDDEEDQDDTRAQEVRFDLQYRDVAKCNKEKELSSKVAIGEDQLAEEDVQRFREAYRERHRQLLDEALQADVVRATSVLREAKTVGVPNGYSHGIPPEWDENANDMFTLRLQVIDRFVRAGSKCLMRMRVRNATKILRSTLRNAGVVDRESCQAWVESEIKAAATGGTSAGKPKSGDGDAATRAAGAVDLVRISPEFVLPVQIPTSKRTSSTEDRQLQEVTPLDNFEELSQLPLKPRLDYKVLEYKVEHVLPPPAAYMRPNNGRLPRLEAVLEELSVVGPCGDYYDGAEKPISMPESCLLAPAQEALSLLIPSPECRTFVRFPDFTECDTAYRLAQVPDMIEERRTETLLPPDIMSLETPFVEEFRFTRQIQDPFQYFDPMPSCFAHGGGNRGPRIGFDAGGERLEFLPVGGFPRDIPSDTDDDDCEDFENIQDAKPPPPEELAAAMEGLSRPYDCEYWWKQKQAEERLNKKFEANGRVIREKMQELNKCLQRRNKLYLG
mmetsp:Transcript_116740/g.330240  ORF Transcript_116740/g.330240 Transcript_116740/m.330240 type:complete len:846 (+) Transcript_116740:3-2540(+)